MPNQLLVFANCQASPITSILRQLTSDLNIVQCPPVHTLTSKDERMLSELIETTDIVVHQPIGEKFGPLSSARLIERFPSKTYVSFPSIYFSGFFPHLTYLRLQGGGTLRGPVTDYHDRRIIDCFLSGKTISECEKRIINDDHGYESHYSLALSTMKERDLWVDIPVCNWVEEAAAERACFYTFNHPDNLILYKIALAVLENLGIRSNTGAGPRQTPYLGNVSAAIPPGVPAAIGATWARNNYTVEREVKDWTSLITDFYNLYRDVPDFNVLAEFNERRKVY